VKVREFDVQETNKPYGEAIIRLFGPDGKLKEERRARNLITAAGLAFIASRMVGVTPDIMSHMAVGTGTTAAAIGNTTLETELARVALTSDDLVTTNQTDDSVEYVATFAAGTGTGALTEAGILNAASAGVLLNRLVFAVVNKGAADSITFTWKVVSS